MKRSLRLRRILGWAIASASLILPGVTLTASAQATSAPVRFVVPLGPGSGSDTLTRFVAERFSKISGRAAIVENRPGGDQTIALQSVLSAPADGSTVMLISSAAVVINPMVSKNPPANAEQGLKPLIAVVDATAAYVVPADSQLKRMEDLLATARQEPRSVSLGTYSLNWEAGIALLSDMADVRFNYIPYKAATQMVTDLVGGRLDVGVMDVGTALPLARAGKLRVLAVSSATPHPDMPDVPTIRDSGVADYEYVSWVGFGIHARTPEPVAKAVEADLLKVVQDAEFRTFAGGTAAFTVSGVTGSKLLAMVENDKERIGKLVKNGALATR